MTVQFCNFNLKGELILFCTARKGTEYDEINLICVYSIQTKIKCQKIFYLTPKEAELISISKHDKIWLRLNNNIYEWDRLTGHATIISKMIYEVNFFFIIQMNLQKEDPL